MKRWRSLLFVPGDNPDKLAKCHTLGADAIIIDLEDAVAEDRKTTARAALGTAITNFQRKNIDVVIRINSELHNITTDLDAAIHNGVSAIMVPKAHSTATIETIAEIIRKLEGERQLPKGEIGIIALIEAPEALPRLPEITGIERVIGLALGTEDFSLALGVTPNTLALDLPVRQIALAAASRKLMAFATPISIASFRDTEAYQTAINISKSVGATGAICIHPNQITIANQAFKVSDTERQEAKDILSLWDKARKEGLSVASLKGQMIDLPVVERARRILAAPE